MSMATGQYTDCPDCGRPTDRDTWCCSHCGAGIRWIFEERRLIKKTPPVLLRGNVDGRAGGYVSCYCGGGFLREIGSMMPLLAAFTALSVEAWLWSDNFDDA